VGPYEVSTTADCSGPHAPTRPGFVDAGARPVVIDEIQRGGEPLARAIKAAVDRDPRPGQSVLTGSSNILTVPTIAESLAGRAGFVEVWPSPPRANSWDARIDSSMSS
jgi:hypothetical protein